MMKIYGGLLSPFVMRAVLAARAKGTDITVETFEAGIKSDAYLAMNPLGKMPLFCDGDFSLPESAVIADFFEDTLRGPSLYPADPKEKARVRLIARFADLLIVPELSVLFNARANPDAVPAAMEKLAAALGHIEHFRTDADTFVVGTMFTAADAALIPLFFFFDAFAKTLNTDTLLSSRPTLQAYWDRMKASDIGSRAVKEQGAALASFFAQPR